MKNYINNNKKTESALLVINEALNILESVGIPLENKSPRALECMAMSFLAVANVTADWAQAIDNANMKTRDIIHFINKHFEEDISPGSYDDIRRKHLKLLVLSDIVVNTGENKGAATNDPTRGYSLNTDFKELVTKYKTRRWKQLLNKFNNNRPLLVEILKRKRNINKISVTLPNGKPINFSFGEHNKLQKAIIEDFLPRFGNSCVVLYVGDTTNKTLHVEESELKKLNFFELLHTELPDIIAYSKQNNWLYLIEAVHSSGPMNETRVLELKTILKKLHSRFNFCYMFPN